MEQEMYAALPIEMGAYGQADQRRATDFAFLMPGVQGNNTTGNATTNTGIVNGSGSRGGVSAVYIDGLPFVRAGGNGDPRFVWTAISVDAVDQFQVQTSGYSAIYEGQGIQNYTVKAGGNKYHGAIYEFFRNTALDTYGFFGSVPNAATGKVTKPVEHSNEFGINLSGPLVPFGAWKDKLFFFGNYNQFRYSSATPTLITFPTLAEQNGDFSAAGQKIYDPSSQTTCTAHSTNGPCRYQYGYGPGTTNGAAGNPVATGAPVNVIPASQFSAVARNLQSYIPTLSNQNIQSNYLAPNPTGLVNFSTTDRIDYVINSKDTLTLHRPPGQLRSGRTNNRRSQRRSCAIQLRSGLRAEDRGRRHRRDPRLRPASRQPVEVRLRSLQRPYLQRKPGSCLFSYVAGPLRSTHRPRSALLPHRYVPWLRTTRSSITSSGS
jgi:hypothetical protein